MLLSNYLFFTDACEEALRCYEACGLGRIVEMVRYGADGMPPKSEAMRGKVCTPNSKGMVSPSMLRTTMTQSRCEGPRTIWRWTAGDRPISCSVR